MDDEQRRHAEELLRITQRRLHKLEEQGALKGSDTPPHIHIEIEDLRAEIVRLQAELERRSPHGETGVLPPHATASGVFRRTNLPAPATTLVGRTQEATNIGALLRRADVRLVTLTGPGGVGKTRLAFHVATELLDEYPDGVWFVDLAPITDTGLVLPTIAHALGVKEIGGQPILETLKTYLRDRHLALLLDNVEHLLDAVPLLGQLLASSPGLKLLVTSRDVLHMYGEHEVTVSPLSLPDSTRPHTPDHLQQSDAVQLFVARAQAVRPDFTLSSANAAAVAAICTRLDGLPLAIELAAARIKLFAPPALLARLDSRLKTLTGGARDLPARQQTLRGALDWSYHLLDASERIVFARLSVFSGGCTIEAAEAVCNAEGELPLDVLEGIVGLMEKSLLQQKHDIDGEPRFVMLETIREYALERLAVRGEVKALREQHLAYYLALAEAAALHLHGAEQIGWADRLESEHDNLRAALTWAHQHGAVDGPSIAGAEAELRLAGALFWFWSLRTHLSEGQRWLEAALARTNTPAHTAARATALFAAGDLAASQSDFVAARVRLEESVALWRELGGQRGLALALIAGNGLGFVALLERRVAEARALFAEGVALWREIGDKWGLARALRGLGAAVRRDDPAAARPIVEEGVALYREAGDWAGLADALPLLATIARLEGDYTRAAALLEESLALGREVGDKDIISVALMCLGDVMQDQGDYKRALALYQESVALARLIEGKQHIAHCLVGLGGVAGAARQAERAARLLSAAETLLDSIGLSLAAWPEVRADYDRYVAAARAQLDVATFAAAWAQGRAMSLEQAIVEAMELGEAS